MAASLRGLDRKAEWSRCNRDKSLALPLTLNLALTHAHNPEKSAMAGRHCQHARRVRSPDSFFFDPNRNPFGQNEPKSFRMNCHENASAVFPSLIVNLACGRVADLRGRRQQDS